MDKTLNLTPDQTLEVKEPISFRARDLMSGITVHKITLLSISLGCIGLLAGTVLIIPFLLGIVSLNYLSLFLVDRYVQELSFRKNFLNSFIITITISLLVLQHYGIIGTLTGNSASLTNQLTVTLGMPFYALLIIGVNSDILNRKYTLPNFLDFLNFVCYVPKFISGPLEKTAFIDELKHFRFKFNSENVDNGLNWIVLGMFFKFIIADNLADLVLINETQSPIIILVSSLFFELRVYFDFAGYSFMAFGGSLALGLPLTLNFNHPFLAKNIQEFWQRWHISLGRWFHTYIHTPIKSTYGKNQTISIVAPLLVFVISGMWHGTTLNFTLWGLFHGCMYLIYVKILRQYQWSRLIGLASLFFVLILGRLLFMEGDTAQLLSKLSSLISYSNWLNDLTHYTTITKALNTYLLHKTSLLSLVLSLCVLGCELISYKRYSNKSPYYFLRTPVAFWIELTLIILLVSNHAGGFIYGRQ